MLVVAVDESVAEWAATPVLLGPGGSAFHAVVLGPKAVPRVTVGDGSPPELALLSALAHGKDEPATIGVAIAATGTLNEERGAAYLDLLRYHLKGALDRALEDIMATSEHKYLSDYARKYYGDGLAAGEAKWKRAALVAFVEARGLASSPEARERIDACSDVVQLDRWIARAATADCVDDVVAD